MYKTFCRTYQHTLKLASKWMNYRLPKVVEGKNSVLKLPELVRKQGIHHVLIVTDQGITALGLMQPLLEGLHAQQIRYAIYDQTVPNPTITNIEEAYELYKQSHCEGIIAFGGGSPMDCAKGVAARVARPNLTIPQMKGLLKIRKEMPPFFAIPTTAGTGSEATVAAVVSNSETHEKYALMDPVLIPHVAVLDPLLTVKLPPFITATTGMDALTHAVEAYIGLSNTEETRRYSREAVTLIFDNLYTAYSDGENMEARKNMQKASYLAGVAFTRAYVGNVHAIAHTLGGFYGVPHGLANAVLLPYLLEFYGETVHKPLAELADVIGIGASYQSVAQKSTAFIEAIKQLNRDMHIPDKIEGIVNRDIPLMVERALKEANPLYPVPKIMNKDEMFYIYQIIQP
ncbi:iron-containing alcohol dehydrogenase [Lysinibacillus sp. KU-BSD001]|uniref:iron-containing alcohol dehydrogenase n=1 Tax=Lysinibacillus sp. KU-BSD001 TaxID=3141328 RepID=UPI0036EEFD31